MKTAYLGAVGALALALGSCSSDEPNNPFDDPKWPTTDEITLSSVDTRNIAALSDFNDKLMSQAALNSTDGSFCVSPLSVSIYLGMIANSCQGEAREQIVKALDCSDLNDFNSLSTRLLRYLTSSKNGAVTHIANHVWVANRYSVPEAYVKTMSEIFNAGVDNVDFSNDQTFKTINSWTSYHTNGMVKSLFDESEWYSQRNVPMVCANSVYFKGSWNKEFDKKKTRNQTFHAVDGDITTPMMHKTDIFRYAADDKAQMISLDYKQLTTAFEIYLPVEGTDVRNIPKIINENERTALRDASANMNVALSMPSFMMEGNLYLDDFLESLGITGFENFDFSPMGISDKYDLVTRHKTAIKVDEKGTEMATVTYNGMESAPQITHMIVDRPFMFVIRNKATQTVLMAGVVTNPKN